MTDWTRYNFITGEVLSVGSCQHYYKFIQAQTDEEHIHDGERIDGNTWYMPGGIKTLRPSLGLQAVYTIVADGDDNVDLTLPVPCDIEDLFTGEMWTQETELFFSSEAATTHRFRIYPAFPYKFQEITINAT